MQSGTLAILRRGTVAIMIATVALSCAAFVRALWKTDQITFWLTDDARRARSLAIRSDRGRLSFIVSRFELNKGFSYFKPKESVKPRVRMFRESWRRETDMALWELPRWNVDLRSTNAAGATDTYTASITTLLLAGVNALLPIYVFQQMRRARAREKIGKCRRCGYDLRATPGACPECGPPSQTLVTRWKNWARFRRQTSSDPSYTPLAGATRFLTSRTQAPRTSKTGQQKK